MAEPDRRFAPAHKGAGDSGYSVGAVSNDDDRPVRPGAARPVATADTGARNGWPAERPYRRGAAREPWAVRAVRRALAEHGLAPGERPPSAAPPASRVPAQRPAVPRTRARIDAQRIDAAIRSGQLGE